MWNEIHLRLWYKGDREVIFLPTAFILFFLPEFLLELPDRAVFLCLLHPFLPFRPVAFGLL
jgi:hypothetical protein